MLTEEKLEKFALDWRQRLGMRFNRIPDIMTIIVKLKREFPSFNYRRVPDSEFPDKEAEWNSETRILSLRESVFTAMQRGEPRARLIVMEEIFHFLLGHQGIKNRAIRPNFKERTNGKTKREEWEARRAAAAFLALQIDVDPTWDAKRVSEEFRISLLAATLRVSELRDMRRRAMGHKRKLPPEVLQFLRNAKAQGTRIITDLDD